MAYVTIVHNLMSVWIVQVGGGAPSWPNALLGAADRVGGDHPDRVRAGDSTRRCARLQRCIRRRVRANSIVLVYSSIGSGYNRREYTRIEDIEGLSSTINLCSPPSRRITMCSPLQGLPAPWIRRASNLLLLLVGALQSILR
jgi:hypothetical protein